MTEAFVETSCTIEFEGKSFTAGGAYILNCTDGIARGAIYVNEKNWSAHTWEGKHIAWLDTATDYRGNFCKMRRISFTWRGVKFVGDYAPQYADLCRVRSTKKATI